MLGKNMKHLEEFTNNFFGYGNLKSDIWFIGHEEGSSQNSITELEARVNVWVRMGKKIVSDCKDFHLNLKMKNEEPFTKSKRQPTWNRYIDFIKNIKDININTKEEKKDFLNYKFAKENSDHCLIELFPIPCSKILSWNYTALSKEYKYFKTKEIYRSYIVDFRLDKIIKLIEENKPKVIIFNGVGFKPYTTLSYWKKIIQQEPKLVQINSNHFYHNINNEINYFIVPKLIYTTNEIVFNIGKLVSKLFKK
jgi:hypothetical protein